jgi:hypothetical protein
MYPPVRAPAQRCVNQDIQVSGVDAHSETLDTFTGYEWSNTVTFHVYILVKMPELCLSLSLSLSLRGGGAGPTKFQDIQSSKWRGLHSCVCMWRP